MASVSGNNFSTNEFFVRLFAQRCDLWKIYLESFRNYFEALWLCKILLQLTSEIVTWNFSGTKFLRRMLKNDFSRKLLQKVFQVERVAFHKLFNSLIPSVHKMITHTVKFLQHLLQGFWSVLDHYFIVTIGSLLPWRNFRKRRKCLY